MFNALISFKNIKKYKLSTNNNHETVSTLTTTTQSKKAWLKKSFN